MAKIKQKTKRAYAKRVKITGTGKVMSKHANRSHLAHNRSTKQKRHLKKDVVMKKSTLKTLKYAL